MPRGGVLACSPLSPADVPRPTGREPHTWSCVCCLHPSSPGGQGDEQGEPRLLELPVPFPWIPDGNGTEGRWHRGVQREEEQRFGFSHLHVVTSTKLCAACVILGRPGAPPDRGTGIAVHQAANRGCGLGTLG